MVDDITDVDLRCCCILTGDVSNKEASMLLCSSILHCLGFCDSVYVNDIIGTVFSGPLYLLIDIKMFYPSR